MPGLQLSGPRMRSRFRDRRRLRKIGGWQRDKTSRLLLNPGSRSRSRRLNLWGKQGEVEGRNTRRGEGEEMMERHGVEMGGEEEADLVLRMDHHQTQAIGF